MKAYKSDGRYKYHNRGLTYIVDFGWANREDKELFVKMITKLRETYGDEKIFTGEADTWGFKKWHWNESWRCEQNRNAKRRRIYLKDEGTVSYILLQVQ